MVQIINMPRTRTVSQAIGEGIGEGFSKGVEAALQDISYEKRLSIQGRQQLMLEEQREARQDQKIWKAANIVSAAKGYPDSAYAIFSMEKASPGFLSKVNEDWAPEDWQNLDTHIKQYSNDQINDSQKTQPPPAAQTAGAQVNGAQGTGSAIQSTNINPRDTASIQQGIMQPMANMRPPSPFPDVNKARATQAMAPVAPVAPVTQQAAPQEAGQQQRAPIAPIGPATQPQPKEMTYAEKVAYNNQHYPRKKALEMNKQALAEESLKLQERNTEAKEKALSLKQDQKYLEESRKSFESAEMAQDSLSSMASIREEGNIGAGSKLRGVYSPEVRSAKALYDTHASNLLNFYKSLFPRGITQTEFKRITDEWLPNSKFTDATNSAREKAFGDMIEHALRKKDAILSLQKQNGTYPANIAAIVEKQMADEKKYMIEKLKQPVVEHKIGEVFDNLPDAREMKGVVIEDEKGRELISDGSSWKLKK